MKNSEKYYTDEEDYEVLISGRKLIKAWLYQKNTEHIQEVRCSVQEIPGGIRLLTFFIIEPKELKRLYFNGSELQTKIEKDGNFLFLHQNYANIFLRKKLQDKLDHEQYMVKFCGNQIQKTTKDQKIHIENSQRLEKILREQPPELLVKIN